jgi:hypothetical protein
VTRRGSFLDDLYRIDRKKYPYATHYNVAGVMPEAHPKNAKKLYETKRNTFIDDILNPKKVKAVPGVGKYNV